MARNIAGEIALAEDPGRIMKKWREIFGIRQNELANFLGIRPSVISDYESGRRKSPGVKFIRRFTDALISTNMRNGGDVVRKFSPSDRGDAILGIREFLSPVKCTDFLKAVDGRVIVNNKIEKKNLWGYTVIDSIKAILELSENDFINFYGSNSKRALIFTKVHLGRSPMVAIKVTRPKPNMVVLHGLHPNKVDKLAVKIAKLEEISLVVSNLRSEDELLNSLSRLRD